MSFIFAMLSIWVIGAGFMLLVERRCGGRYSVPEMAALPVLIGMGAVSVLLFAYGMTGVRFNLINFAIVPVLVFIMMAARYASRPEKFAEITNPGSSRYKWSRVEKLLLVGLLLQTAWVVFLAMSVPVSSHDAVANYALKSKIFYFSGGIPQGFFAWGEDAVAHPDYPLLPPLIMTWVYAFTGFNDLLVKMIMPVIYVCFLAVFFSRMRRLFNPAYALLGAFILGTIPQLSDYATIIHADLMLTVFVTCGILYFVSYARQKDRACLVFSSVLMGFSLWVKNEAIVFVSAFMCCFFLLVLRSAPDERKRALKDMFFAAAVILAIALPWFAVKLSAGAVNSDLDLKSLTSARILKNVKDIPIILNLFQQEVFGPKKWNIFWVMFFASVVWKRKRLWQGESAYLTLFLALSAAGYFVGYMATTGENLFFYVNTTISRFMLHFSGAAAILMSVLVYGDIRKIKSFGGGTE
jgi:4-amino-4-deoxy-L-arabinose transferase-like glycosyltransferase